jgi:polysaccharide pyruvyl transferase WcaK-like protein
VRILFDQAIYDMRNKGNVALLQMALRRIHKLWPEASLEVMTDAPHLLKLYCPEAVPVSVFDWHNWSENRDKFERLHRVVPRPVLRTMFEIREEFQYRGLTSHMAKQHLRTWLGRPNGYQNWEGPIMEASEPQACDPPDLEQAMQGADLVIGTGGGYLVDSDKSSTHPVLTRLARAKRLGKFTALVGQGVGRIEEEGFRALARTVLPEIDLILVREGNFAIPLLESLGVPPERIHMSGDDAVELAYEARNETLGSDLGVSVRLAGYTDVGHRDLAQIRPVLHRAAARHGARLRGIPTSCCGVESDQFKIAELLAGYPKTVGSWVRFESTTDIIKKVGHCRVMVAGAFHGAVFALSQGIPAIGLARTKEYEVKFGGLVDQFGPGCQLLYLDDEQLPAKLAAAIDEAWEAAERLRPQLLQAARAQIQLGHMGYRRLYDLYQSRLKAQPTNGQVQAAR